MEIPVKKQIAMTGEMSLTGRLLRVGGLREKILAANRAGFGEVIVPMQNHDDLEAIPPEVRQSMVVREMLDMEEVLRVALVKEPWRQHSQKQVVWDADRCAVVNPAVD